MGAWRALMKYVKAAFFWRWNLLFFGAGVAAGVLSGKPDVVLPLLAAAELTYLGLLTSRPRFRQAIDARTATRRTEADQTQLLRQIKAALPPEAWARFEELRNRCLALDKLSQRLRGPHEARDALVTDLQTGSLERLLWMFLKLLYSQDALQRFLRETDRDELALLIAAAEKELKRATEQGRSQKLIGSIKDKLETLRQRLANYDRTIEHQEFLKVEIDRIEQKVNAISEMAINARDPADISAQVDGIAEGISATEEAIRSLDVAPVLERDEAPKLLSMEQR